MTATLLDGKALSEKILLQCAERSKNLHPKLVVLLVGENPASTIYVKNKEISCQKAGIESEVLRFSKDISEKELLKEIERLNQDDSVHGFFVQLPVPDHISVPQIIRAIDPKKDVDGFHAYNVGKMFLSADFEDLPPATPAGIITLLEEYNIPFEGKEVVVVGHSNLVGKPISTMLLNRNATVTTCHKFTKNLAEHTKRAEILIVAAGVPGLISGDMVSEGVVVVDVGINRLDDGRIVGDVDFETVSQKASFISPVPGGVGPMTVASLMMNTLSAAERQ